MLTLKDFRPNKFQKVQTVGAEKAAREAQAKADAEAEAAEEAEDAEHARVVAQLAKLKADKKAQEAKIQAMKQVSYIPI